MCVRLSVYLLACSPIALASRTWAIAYQFSNVFAKSQNFKTKHGQIHRIRSQKRPAMDNHNGGAAAAAAIARTHYFVFPVAVAVCICTHGPMPRAPAE